MPPPTFLRIGAQKCGTTWLAAGVLRRMPGWVKTPSRWHIPVSNVDRAALADAYAPGIARPETMLGRRLPWSGAARTHFAA